jgi:hypothetical protein
MHLAKERQTGVEDYTSGADRHSVTHLSLRIRMRYGYF